MMFFIAKIFHVIYSLFTKWNESHFQKKIDLQRLEDYSWTYQGTDPSGQMLPMSCNQNRYVVTFMDGFTNLAKV